MARPGYEAWVQYELDVFALEGGLTLPCYCPTCKTTTNHRQHQSPGYWFCLECGWQEYRYYPEREGLPSGQDWPH